MCIGMWAYVIRVANPNILLQATLTEDRAGELGDTLSQLVRNAATCVCTDIILTDKA